MSQETRKSIAGKLLLGVKNDRIVTDVRGAIPVSGQETRNHVITKKDVNNIKSSIGISNSHIPDEVSVNMWVKDNNNSILCYKEQNTEHHDLDYKDFFLAIMMPIQSKMLMEFGGDRICIDSTHGTAGYGFELITLMVIDDFEEGFPVAFCLTSTVNFKNLVYFLKLIKSAIPEPMNVNVFMSDDAPFFYQAWESVFGYVDTRLLCAWHVDRSWQGHLNTVSKEKRTSVYQALKSVMYELDEATFTTMLERFLEELKLDYDTRQFYDYFVKYYQPRMHMWAYCYRKGAKINTNMHIEHFHKELKHVYLDGKKCKRVDKCCESLKRFIDDKHFERLIKTHKGKITRKHTASYHRHKLGSDLISDCLQVFENQWEVQSSTLSNKKYIVLKLHVCTPECNKVCRECFCCKEAYKCSCHDYCILNNICKHIHAVNILSMSGTSDIGSYTGPLNRATEVPVTADDLATPGSTMNSSTYSRESLLQECGSLYASIESRNMIDEGVAKQLMQLLHTANSLLNLEVSIPENSVLNAPKEPWNKRIVPQKRFYSTKKEKSKRKRLNKPSTEECANAKNYLLNEPLISFNNVNDHNYL